ncbi:single-stranded DNA-binding protein [Lentzea jiangxiensis]|uniref:single-stranded DNA-binding protein n=1 Tax=Lentzea jiangxiensis TaxID=641025 RepID=UPI001FE113CD|nr:single-stranded DNA-binding protein [Lentzea jiangxiensis]
MTVDLLRASLCVHSTSPQGEDRHGRGFRELVTSAENAAESLTGGARVVFQGRLRQRSCEAKEGEKRAVVSCKWEKWGFVAVRNSSGQQDRL